MSSKAVFMGRAGTLHKLQKNGHVNIDGFEIFTGVSESLNILGQLGYFLAVVGSEKAILPGVDYPAFIETAERYIANMVCYPIDFKLCTHHPAKKCQCRLPKPGLIKEFESELDLDLNNSIMVASREAEVAGALKAKIPIVLRLETGRGEWSKMSQELPIFETFREATEYIRVNNAGG